jgi:ArsR family transcriptional regulator
MALSDSKKRLYALQAEIVRALAHPLRMAVVDFLADGEQCVCDIANHLGARRPNVSRHLALMLKAGVLGSRRDGLRVVYSLRTPCIVNCLTCAADVLREHIQADSALLRKL